MDPATGTFTTMDTYGGNLSDPMSLHKYLFANSNPVMYSDPSGHISLEEFDITAAIDSMLESVAMDLLEWAITDPECEEKTFGEHVKDLFIDMAWGFFSGGFGSCISKKIGADSLFGSVKDKLTGFPQKLSLAEKYALGAIFILSFIAIPVGIVLKAEAENTDDIHLSNFLNGLGDAILDTYYIILSKLFNCPSALVPAYIDAIVIISKHGDE